MDYVTFLGPAPQDLRRPPLIAAFSGWTDGQESATRAIRYIVRRSHSVRFAMIDSEDFYDFTQVRPFVYLNEEGNRRLRWPTNEFYYVRADPPGRDLLLFLGSEPSLKWRTYCTLIMDVAQRCGVSSVVTLGSLLDNVPHTREPRVSGYSDQPELQKQLEGLGARNSNYQGPTGISSALMERCNVHGITFASILGHAPHYLQVAPNPRVTHALLRTASSFLKFPIDLTDIKARENTFQGEVNQAVGKNPEVQGYVRRLEEQYDANFAPAIEMPDAKDVVQDLDDFLRRQSRPPQTGGP